MGRLLPCFRFFASSAVFLACVIIQVAILAPGPQSVILNIVVRFVMVKMSNRKNDFNLLSLIRQRKRLHADHIAII